MNSTVKLFFCLVTVVFTYSCNEISKPQQIVLQKEGVKSQSQSKEWMIDSLGLQVQYDSVKWFVYSLCFPDTLKWSIARAGDEKDVYTFGELNIDLDTLAFRMDTVDFKIRYSIPCDDHAEQFIGNVNYVLHIGLVMNENKVVYYITASNFERIVDSTVKSQIAEQLEFLPDYLHQVKKINPSFKDQLLKKGLISY